MLISLLVLAIAAAGGFAFTYLIDDDSPFMWRLAAGNIIGAAVFGTFGFVLALAFGLNAAVVVAALVAAILPVGLLYRGKYRNAFQRDWSRAKGRLQGANLSKFWRF